MRSGPFFNIRFCGEPATVTSTFINPIVNPDAKLGVNTFDEMAQVELRPGASAGDVATVIRAVYRHVLGNAHIMESERLTVAESQLQNGSISVRQFVRLVAQSDLYRSRFVENCYRYRAIELNFKHLLGRAPADFEEMRHHSEILDREGDNADIDSYIDSAEYSENFGENIVPYYRGHRSETAKGMQQFNHMLKLVKSVSSSDQDPTPRLTRAIIEPTRGSAQGSDITALLNRVLNTTPSSVPSYNVAAISSAGASNQDTEIAALQRQLAEIRGTASIGAAITSQWSSNNVPIAPAGYDRASQIAALQQELAVARAFAAIGESRLNRWRSKTFTAPR
jgi:phycoerythrin-associated linker protein